MSNCPVIVGGYSNSGSDLVSKVMKMAGCTIDYPASSRNSFILNQFFDRWVNAYLVMLVDGITQGSDLIQAEFRATIESYLESFRLPENGTWSWDEPRSIYMLPFFYHFYPKMKFIHVVRNSIDSCYAMDKDQLHKHGDVLLGVNLQSRDAILRSADMWNRVNAFVNHFGTNYLKDRYMLLRIEDLHKNTGLVSRQLLKFVDSPHSSLEIKELIEKNSLSSNAPPYKTRILTEAEEITMGTMCSLGYYAS